MLLERNERKFSVKITLSVFILREQVKHRETAQERQRIIRFVSIKQKKKKKLEL